MIVTHSYIVYLFLLPVSNTASVLHHYEIDLPMSLRSVREVYTMTKIVNHPYLLIYKAFSLCFLTLK